MYRAKFYTIVVRVDAVPVASFELRCESISLEKFLSMAYDWFSCYYMDEKVPSFLVDISFENRAKPFPKVALIACSDVELARALVRFMFYFK